jgi:hypothetical protein
MVFQEWEIKSICHFWLNEEFIVQKSGVLQHPLVDLDDVNAG